MLDRMNEVRVGVRVSGAEGARMARSLEAAGFVVSRLDEASEASSRARVVVVEVASTAEVAGVLREWRSTAAGAPPTVVLVGPEDADPSAFAAADAFFRRPVPVADLVRAVRRFLSADRASRAQTREGFSGEPTVRVEKGVRPSRTSSRPPPTTSSGALRAPGTSANDRDRAARRARLSPALEALLLAADRRLFPDATALPLDLPGADARPSELVPDELLASPSPSPSDRAPFGVVPASFEDEPPAEPEPPIEPEAPASAEATDPLVPPEPPIEPEAPSAPEPLATTALLDRRPRPVADAAPPGAQTGAALLLSLADRASPHRVAWRDAEGRAVAVELAGGAVVRFEGPLDRDASRRLYAEGRIAEPPPAGEETDFLDRSVEEGLLRGVDLARCRREVIEAFVAALALARAEAAQVDEAERAPLPPPPLTRPVRAIVVDAYRAAAAEPLGDDEAFFLRGGAQAALASFGVLPEERAALEAVAGVPASALRARSHGVRGLEGLVALVLDLGLATVAPPAAALARPASAAALRVHLANAAARAADGSYFEILGIPLDADGGLVERARDRLVGEIASLDLPALGLAGLERERARILDALDEACTALRSDRLRRAYAAALAAPEGGR